MLYNKNMLNDYLYKSPSSQNPTKAMIVLPEIFGLTDFICQTTDRFANELGISTYALDFFYQLNHVKNKFDYATDMQKGVELMQQMRGTDFIEIFSTALADIKKDLPSLEAIYVCGFCFGGRLAYVAGSDRSVSKVISFYGAGANMPNFINDKSAVQNLAEMRANDKNLSVLSLYGANDDSILSEDRAKTEQELKVAGINYEAVVYNDTGHGFFNSERANMYNTKAAEEAWQKVKEFLS